MNTNHKMLARMETKTDATLMEMKWELTTRMEAKIGVNPENMDTKTTKSRENISWNESQ
jgi:hypothetical protein